MFSIDVLTFKLSSVIFASFFLLDQKCVAIESFVIKFNNRNVVSDRNVFFQCDSFLVHFPLVRAYRNLVLVCLTDIIMGVQLKGPALLLHMVLLLNLLDYNHVVRAFLIWMSRY